MGPATGTWIDQHGAAGLPGTLSVFEILDCALVFFGCFQAIESAEIFAFICLRSFLARIDAVLSGFQFTYHKNVFFESTGPRGNGGPFFILSGLLT
jgi:hypothetical protein